MKETDIEKFIEEKYTELSSGFLNEEVPDEWSCEEEGMNLLEGMQFIDYCEKKYKQVVDQKVETENKNEI